MKNKNFVITSHFYAYLLRLFPTPLLYYFQYIFFSIVLIGLLPERVIAQENYLKGVIDDCILVQPESYLSHASLQANSIILSEIGSTENGYFDFSFLELDEIDDISFSLENTDGSIFYQVRFQSGQMIWSDHTGEGLSLPIDNYNNIAFTLQKCTSTLEWYKGNTILVKQFITSDELLHAKVEVHNQSNAIIDLVFNTNVTECQTTPISSTTLVPGDLMFAGYENTATGTRLTLMNLVPLPPNTSFQLLSGNYHNSQDEWKDLANLGLLPIQEIIYVGNSSIPAGSKICFYLPNTGTGDQVLATNFEIQGQPSTDFQVNNIGNTSSPKIFLPNDKAAALFLTQGTWRLSEASSILFGRVLSGLQYGGVWTDDFSNPIDGFSNIPEDILCIAIEDGLPPDYRYAYYKDGLDKSPI